MPSMLSIVYLAKLTTAEISGEIRPGIGIFTQQLLADRFIPDDLVLVEIEKNKRFIA